MSAEEVIKQLESCVAQAAEQTGYEIYESRVYMRKGVCTLDVRIDNGAVISHEDCARFSSQLNNLIEARAIEADYSLEVSSPGFKRKLRNRAEYLRFTGSPVKILSLSGEPQSVYKGILLSCGDDSLRVREETGKVCDIGFSDVKSAFLDL
jgi:ribosome maturation factor RimP